ncbi:MAG TPA: dockerin type I domain-containing protein, partial [Candidatus Udaeobacter sp.]|nr:dockerin type I domain-containing protein [Candidatus Udaeobacter sp.]
LTITLVDVSDGTTTGNVSIPMHVLLGDTTGNGTVNASDVSQTKSQSGQVATASNFRTDVTVTGVINASDVSLVKSKSGNGLP